jgi:hypothetical protein
MSSPPTTERRRSRRRKPLQLVYLEFGRENGGMIKDVSEGGMRFHLINPVAVGQSLNFAVTIDAARRLEGQALMVWTDAGGKSGGMSFSGISAESRDTLNAWLAEIDSPHSANPVSAPRTIRPSGENTPVVSVPDAPEPVQPTAVAATSLVATAVLENPVASVPAASVAVDSPPFIAPSTVQAVVVPIVSPGAPKETPVSLGVAEKLLPALAMPFSEAARPVTREDWIRSARENPVPGERGSKPIAMVMPVRDSGTSVEDKLQLVLQHTRHETRPAESRKFEKLADRVDPLREFLRQPLDNSAPAPVEEAAGVTLDERPRNIWSTSRVVMVLGLAAICGAAAAFAAIAYRQNVGESIIELGEKISGEPRSQVGGEAALPPAAPSPAVNSQPDSSKPTAKRPATSGTNSTAPPSVPPATQPTTPQHSSPISQTNPQTLQKSPISQTELAAGREIVAGKPKRVPEDVASLWLAVENGDANAEVQLADRYLVGNGVEKNCDQGRVLLQAAAKRGSELATRRLAELSGTGCQ